MKLQLNMTNVTATTKLLSLFALLVLSINAPAEAQVCFSSDASAAAYDDGWQTGDNDGTDFGPWSLSTSSGDVTRNGHFIGTSTLNGDGVDNNVDGDIDTAGRAWGLYANQSNFSRATRPFDSPLVSGSTFSIRIDNGIVDPGGYSQVGFELENSLEENLVILAFVPDVNPTHYIILDGVSLRSTGVPFTDEGIQVDIVMLTTTDYEMTITNLFDGAQTILGGILSSPGGGQSVDAVSIFNFFAGPDPLRDLFVNDLQICYPDTDNDGVRDAHDFCPGTVIPESVPTRKLGVNRFALVDGDSVFDTRSPKGKGPQRSYTTADTAGCSCTQITEALGLGKGHTKFGCSISAMDDWVDLVNP